MNTPKHLTQMPVRHRPMSDSLPGEYEFPFEDELDHFQHLRSVRQRTGVREYIHDQTDVLFVTSHLPLCGCPDELLFGGCTRSIFAVMREQCLIPSLGVDPTETEIEVFGMRAVRTKKRPFSIVAVFSTPECIQGRRVTFGDWERIWGLLEPLNVQRIAILGKSLIEKYNWRLDKRQRRPTAYGLIEHRTEGGRLIPVFGLPLTNLKEDGHFFSQLVSPSC